MVEFNEAIAYYLYRHSRKIVHMNSVYFCYDSDVQHFMYRYVDEDDKCWRICEELDKSLINYFVLND